MNETKEHENSVHVGLAFPVVVRAADDNGVRQYAIHNYKVLKLYKRFALCARMHNHKQLYNECFSYREIRKQCKKEEQKKSGKNGLKSGNEQEACW